MGKHVTNLFFLCALTLGFYLYLFGIPASSGDFSNIGSYSSGTAGLLAALYFGLETIRARDKTNESARIPGGEVRPTAAKPATEGYSIVVGRRLEKLRRDVLKLSLREMAEFLGIESVTQLERNEAGVDEYPLSLVKKLEVYFRLNSRFVESGVGAIFDSFSLSQDSVNYFLAQGYSPVLACCPKERADLLCCLVFVKRSEGVPTQIAMADGYGSFASSGGGKSNVAYLITALLDMGKKPSFARIVKVTEQEWDGIMKGTYYDKHPFARFGGADWECMEIFDAWFDECTRDRARWAQYK